MPTIKVPETAKYAYAPTRQCNICKKMENEHSLCIEGGFWICDECCGKIATLIDKSESEAKTDENR